LVRCKRCGAYTHAPVIKHTRNVDDLFRRHMRQAAQEQVMILTSLHAGPEPSDTAKQTATIYAQMGNVVLREEQIGIPIALEVRIESISPFTDLVFVTVKNLGARVPIDGQHHEVQ